jgi:molecular chaperone GrpE
VSDLPAPPATQRAPEPAAGEPDPRLLRALADLENVRKRCERRLATAAKEERRRVLSAWLPVVDDLERALLHGDGDGAGFVKGVRAVYEHALAVLARLGLERFEDVGKHFDPERHEAVGTVESEAESGVIIATPQPGYASAGETVRPARVVVARGRPGGSSDAHKSD